MDGESIKKALTKKGLSFSSVARAIGVSPSTISGVAHRTKKSWRGGNALARALELPVNKVFPDVKEYHAAEPQPAHLRKSAQDNRARKLIGHLAVAS